jgi:hypothetical protein
VNVTCCHGTNLRLNPQTTIRAAFVATISGCVKSFCFDIQLKWVIPGRYVGRRTRVEQKVLVMFFIWCIRILPVRRNWAVMQVSTQFLSRELSRNHYPSTSLHHCDVFQIATSLIKFFEPFSSKIKSSPVEGYSSYAFRLSQTGDEIVT